MQAEAEQPAYVELGRIVGAHALRGEVRVRYFGDGPTNLLSIESVWLAASRADTAAQHYAVLAAGTGRASEVRLRLEGVEGRDAAEALRGLLVLGDEADLAPLNEGDYYWHQLIGCSVWTEQGEEVGRVEELWETGAHDVLVVTSERHPRLLIPTAQEIMKTVDLAGRRIVIEAIPGLLDPE